MRTKNHKIDGRNRNYLINSYRYEKAEFKTLSGGANQNCLSEYLLQQPEFKTLSGGANQNNTGLHVSGNREFKTLSCETKGLGYAVL